MPAKPTPDQATRAFAHATLDAVETANTVSRDWRAYLEAQITLVRTAMNPDSSDAIERSDETDRMVSQANATVRALSPAWRSVFDDYIETYQRNEAQNNNRPNANGKRMPSPQESKLNSLRDLLARARGEVAMPDAPHDGWGEVPLQGGQIGYVDVAGDRLAPEVWQDTARQQIGVPHIAALAALGLLGIVTVIWSVITLTTPVEDAPVVQISPIIVNGTPSPAWDIEHGTLLMQDGGVVAIQIVPVAQFSTVPAGKAGWNMTIQRPPLELCVDKELIADVAGVTVIGTLAHPDRTYTVIEEGEPDLLITSCQQGGVQKSAILSGVTPRPILTIGERNETPLTIQGQPVQITVQEITVIGPAADPSLPQDRARVEVLAQVEPITMASALAHALIVETGETVSSLPPVVEETGIQFGYIIQMPLGSTSAQWRVRGSGTQLVRWEAQLMPPPTRSQIVYENLTIVDIVADEQSSAGILRVRVRVQNTGEQPVPLVLDDIVVKAGGQGIATTVDRPTRDGLSQPIAPGERRELVIEIPPSNQRGMIELTIGGERFEIK